MPEQTLCSAPPKEAEVSVGMYVAADRAAFVSKHEAEAQGFNDAIMLDWRGYVAECTGANILRFGGAAQTSHKLTAHASPSVGVAAASSARLCRPISSSGPANPSTAAISSDRRPASAPACSHE